MKFEEVLKKTQDKIKEKLNLDIPVERIDVSNIIGDIILQDVLDTNYDEIIIDKKTKYKKVN